MVNLRRLQNIFRHLSLPVYLQAFKAKALSCVSFPTRSDQGTQRKMPLKMKYTISVNPQIKPYLLTFLVLAFSFLFYYFFNFFFLKNRTYQQLVTLLQEPNISQSDTKENEDMAEGDESKITDRTIPIVGIFNTLKNSSNAEHHLALAQYYERLSINTTNPVERGTQAVIENDALAPFQDSQAYYESEALNHFQRAVILNPLSSKYHIFLAEFLGHIYEERPHDDTYNPQIKKMIMHHFESATILDNKWDHPFRAYGNWLFSFAKSEEACNNADLLKQTLDLAVLMYKEAIKRNNALFLEAMERYNAFTNNYNELKKIIPEVPDLYYSFAKYLQKIDLWEVNEDNFYHDIQSHTDRFPLYRAVIEYLCQKQRFAEGVHVLKEYLEYAPDDANTHLWLGNVLFYNLHNKEEGIQEIEIAVKSRPDDISILFSYGRMLFLSEEYEKSIETLKGVISRDAKRHDAYFLIAQSYERLRNMREAEEAYENAVSLNPNSTEYKKHLARLRIEVKMISHETSHTSSQ